MHCTVTFLDCWVLVYGIVLSLIIILKSCMEDCTDNMLHKRTRTKATKHLLAVITRLTLVIYFSQGDLES